MFKQKVVDIPEDILKVKEEIEVEIHGEQQNWNRAAANVSILCTL